MRASKSTQKRLRRPVVPAQKLFLEMHLPTLMPLVRKIRTLSHAYSRGFIWEAQEGDWVLYVDPEGGEERIQMVWSVVDRTEDNGAHADEKMLVFDISFPDDRYDEVVDAGDVSDCLFLPTERQCWEWLNQRECYFELSWVGEATEIRPVIAVPKVKPIHPTPLHALYALVSGVLETPRRL